MKAKYPVIDGKKICLTCEIEKSADDFYLTKKKGKSYIQPYCKLCATDRIHEIIKKNAAKVKTAKLKQKEEATTKICTKCRKEKNISDYHVASRKSGPYIAPSCKTCTNSANIESKIKYTEKNGISYSKIWHKKFKEENGESHSTIWGRTNPEKSKLQCQQSNLRVKQKLVMGYGGACTCCGETQIEFLTVEHINHDGKQHREALAGPNSKSGSGNKMYLDIIKRGFPPEYTIHCWNCNLAKRHGAPCPHENKNTTILINTNSEHCYEVYQDW